MLNKPKFMSPSINVHGSAVIDLNSDTLPFSCIVDGNEAITKFQIKIYRIEDNELIFDTGVQSLSSPFYPVNNRNQNVVFTVDLKQYENNTTSTYGFENRSEAYYWSIALTGVSNVTTQSAEEVFYANSTPNTSVYYSYDNNFSDSLEELLENTNLTKRKVYFKATYSQSEEIPIKRYGWKLTDTTNNVIIMDTITKNQIYGVSEDISCVYNGLVNQSEYLLELYIETQNGYFKILNSIDFTVDYIVKPISADFDTIALNNTSGIMLGWGNIRTTEGVVVGSPVSYEDHFPVQNTSVIKIPFDTKVVFEGTSSGKDLEIDEDSYIVLSFQFDKTEDMVLFEISGENSVGDALSRKLEYISSDNKFKYTIREGTTLVVYESESSLSSLIGELCWYVITLYPLTEGETYYELIESVAENGVFPSDELYPSNGLCPNFGTWDKIREGVL